MGVTSTLSVREVDLGAAPRVGLPVATPVGALMRDFLTWLACKPRTYAEAMEAWRSSCPRYTIWEDALSDGLINVARGSSVKLGEASVTITAQGCAILAGT